MTLFGLLLTAHLIDFGGGFIAFLAGLSGAVQ